MADSKTLGLWSLMAVKQTMATDGLNIFVEQFQVKGPQNLVFLNRVADKPSICSHNGSYACSLSGLQEGGGEGGGVGMKR